METISYLKKHFGGLDRTNVHRIIKDMQGHGVRMSYDWSKGLCIFSANKSTKHDYEIQSDIVAECNGLILDFEFTPIVVPKRNAFNAMNKTEIRKRFDANMYNVYEAHEGTVVNFYFREGAWRMSSNRGIDVGDLRLEKSTWMELFRESLAATSINAKDFFECLNPDTCYTFGFTHPEIHPFNDALEKMGRFDDAYPHVWFIQKATCDAQGFTLRRLLTEWLALPTQTSVHRKVSLDELMRLLEDSYSSFIEGGAPLYGFILEVDRPQPYYDPYESVFLESHLMTMIRKLFYDHRLYAMSKELRLPRSQLLDWYSLLDSSRTSYYLSLMPHKSDVLVELESKFDLLVDSLMEGKSKGDPRVRLLFHLVKHHMNSKGFDKSTKRNLIKQELRSPANAKAVLAYLSACH